MHPRLLPIVTAVAFILATGFLEPEPAGAATRILPGDAVTHEDQPRIEVLSSSPDGLALLFELPALAVDSYTVDGRSFQSVAIPGGGLQGEPGSPAIPSFTRLLAVPENVGLRLIATIEEEEELSGFVLLPVQEEEGEEFAFDPTAYARDGFDAGAAAVTGAPALCRDQRLVPLTFQPVSFNPARQTLKVARRLRVEVRFEGSDLRNARPSKKPVLPTSFDALYRHLVVNYEGPREGQRLEPGTWLVICPNDPLVISRLQPLVQWRQRKGSPTRVATMAETGNTAVQIKDFIQNAYDTWPEPPEYVVLAGDATSPYIVPTWYEDMSGQSGEGDHPYTLLEGDDYLSDVHVGRLSFGSTTELEVIVNKIVGYESTPFVQDFTWFGRACLVGDPESSGYSTVQVMQWIKTRLRQIGYSQIDTVFQAPFVSQMSTALNRGDSFFAYRGFGGMSGWSNTNTNNLTNGWRLPFAVVSTCGTGSFAQGTSISEAFLRSGSVATPKAAVGASATATNGTHTRFNNCFVMGVAQGLFYEDLWPMGAAITRGKMELYLNYGQSPDAMWAHVFAHWNNLMGDPAAECWTGLPRPLTVIHPASVPLGSNTFAVTVNQAGSPVGGAQVCCLKGTETFVVGYTDDAGVCEVPLHNATAGDLLLTITKHNHQPYRATVPVAALPLFVGLNATALDDDNAGESHGNGDQTVNPGETIELRVQLRNFGIQSSGVINATLGTEDPYLTVSDESESFGIIPGGGSVWSQDDFGFSLSPLCPDAHVLRFSLDVTDGINHWRSLVELRAVSAAFSTAGTTLYGAGDGVLDPGEAAGLSVLLHNDGGAAAGGTTGLLRSLSPWVIVLDSLGVFGDIDPGGQFENTGDTFTISAAPDAYPGHLAVFSLITQFNGGASDSSVVSLIVGQRSSRDPIGPDQYGYYGFDNTDEDYPSAPVYSWVEIDPSLGGPGEIVPLDDYADYQDKSRIVSLPFPFNFYGQTFTRATICSNGWIAMGETYLTDYRNWTIPGAGAPQNLLAVFWDDLYEHSSGGHVYQYRDSVNHRWIVEWSQMVNAAGFAVETFQAILYDPAFHPTATGDGVIVYQYHTIDNTDTMDGYSTVGVQNWNHTDGLLYTYFNLYPAGAAPLAAGRAIRFLPVVAQPQGTLQGLVLNSSHGDAPIEGATVRLLETGRAFSTGPDGLYGGPVSGGTYTATASHPSFAADTLRNVVVTQSQITTLDFHLTDIGGPIISEVSDLGPSVPDPGPSVVQAEIIDASTVAEAKIVYRVNETGWMEVAMSPNGGHLFSGTLPAMPAGLRVDYYIWARDGLGMFTVYPPAAPSTFFTYYRTEELYASACEDPGDPVWQLGVAGDAAVAGVWIRDDPIGTEYTGQIVQAEDDHTLDPGIKCFVTGNGSIGGAAGEADVDGGCTTLLSPTFDLSGAEMGFLVYWRWYGEGGNSIDDEFAVDVSSDGGSTWHAVERVPENATGWNRVAVELSTLVSLTDRMVIRFLACDLNSAGLVEAAIDDVALDRFDAVSVGAPEGPSTTGFALGSGRPNPFTRGVDLRFSLARTGPARLALYDVQGRLVLTLVQGTQEAGPHQILWDGRDERGLDVPSGIYFARFTAGNESEVRKLIRLE